MLYSIIATSIMYAIIKYLKGFSTYQIIFFRSIASLAFTIPLILKNKINILGNNKRILMLRGFLGLISMFFFFQSIKYLDLGISVSIRYTSPIFATIFAMLLLKEIIKKIQWLFIIISFVGVIIINVVSLEIDVIGFVYALISAISLGLVFVITSKIGNTENSLVVVNYFMFIAFVFTGLMSIDKWVNPSLLELMLLLFSGVFGYIGLLYLTKSFQKNDVNILAPLKYLEVIFSVILGICFFGEIYSFWSLIAVFFILIGVVLNTLLKNYKNYIKSLNLIFKYIFDYSRK